jgi:AbrB family looped-hinge helix DNA binding protein
MPYVSVMGTLTITAKGQVTLRKELLRHLGVGPGDKINVEAKPDGRIEVSAVRKTGKISDVAGMLYREDGPRLTIEEINEAIAKGWAGELNGA